MGVAAGATFLFLLLQTIMVVDGAIDMAETLVQHRDDSGRTCCFNFMLATVTALGWAAILALCITILAWNLGALIITLTIVHLAIILVMHIVAVSTRVQEMNSHSGILQASVSGAYSTFVHSVAVAAMYMRDTAYATTLAYIGVLLLMLTLIRCLRVDIYKTDAINEEDGSSADIGKIFLFHLTYVLAALSLPTLLGKWSTLDITASNVITFSGLPANLWLYTVASWSASALYIWVVVAPLVTDRTYG